jgi:hypothetical protein
VAPIAPLPSRLDTTDARPGALVSSALLVFFGFQLLGRAYTMSAFRLRAQHSASLSETLAASSRRVLLLGLNGAESGRQDTSGDALLQGSLCATASMMSTPVGSIAVSSSTVQRRRSVAFCAVSAIERAWRPRRYRPAPSITCFLPLLAS